MSYHPNGPGGQGEQQLHSGRPNLDLAYANERLRNENTRFGHNHNINNGTQSTPQGSREDDMDKNGSRRKALLGLTSPRSALRQRSEIAITVLSAMLLAVIVFCLAVFTVQGQSRCSPAESPLGENPNPSGVVNLSYGKYQGTSLANGVDQYLGMRYAATPTRFAASQAPQNFTGTQQADKYGPGCKGSGSTESDDAEDCLFVDVFTPTQKTSNSKFAVFVFIQGGGLIDSSGHFNGSGLVLASNMSIVTVSFTYRVGLFGFLASSEIQSNGSLNNGYYDQHQLLQWVQKEIVQFGGDPSHVVIGGQSAGAGSVVNHLTAFGGVDQHLFRGAIMESQSMPPVRNVSQQQFQYDSLVNSTGCGNTPDTLSCLRGLSYSKLLSHGGPIPYPGNSDPPVYAYNPVVDGKFVTGVPISMFSNGQFVHVPTVFGDDTNEGTIFTPRDLKTSSQSAKFLNDNFPGLTSDQLDQLASIYKFDNTDISNYWLQASWAYGELRYICPGIHMSTLITNHSDINVWNWRYNIATPAQKADFNLVSHGSEMPAIWGPQYQGPSGPAEMLATNATDTVTIMQGYWISFIKTLDPNKIKPDLAPTWDAWDGSNRVLFNSNETSMETIDNGQTSRCGYISQLMEELQQ